jgi:lipopolysaccharide biosynthesis protein
VDTGAAQNAMELRRPPLDSVRNTIGQLMQHDINQTKPFSIDWAQQEWCVDSSGRADEQFS